MIQRRRAFAIVLFALAAALSGCGGSGNSPTAPTPSATPIPTVRTEVAAGSASVPARVLALVPFTINAAGTLDATVDWTFATNDVHVYLITGSCTSVEQFNGRQCFVGAFSESTLLKPERVTFAGVQPGTYTLGIGNVGPGDESVSFEVVLTTQGLRGQ
jgi:hypothetical protein